MVGPAAIAFTVAVVPGFEAPGFQSVARPLAMSIAAMLLRDSPPMLREQSAGIDTGPGDRECGDLAARSRIPGGRKAGRDVHAREIGARSRPHGREPAPA